MLVNWEQDKWFCSTAINSKTFLCGEIIFILFLKPIVRRKLYVHTQSPNRKIYNGSLLWYVSMHVEAIKLNLNNKLPHNRNHRTCRSVPLSLGVLVPLYTLSTILIPDEGNWNDLGMTTEMALTFCFRYWLVYWLYFSLSLVSIFFLEWRRRMNWSRVHLVSSKQARLASMWRLSLNATSQSWLQVGQQCNVASFLAFSPPPSSFSSISPNFVKKLLKVEIFCICLL